LMISVKTHQNPLPSGFLVVFFRQPLFENH
jgi:hypothetical protein